MKRKASVAIVGGGVHGLSIAYNLAKRGQRDIVLFEKSYLGAGASGRNAGGIRAQFSVRENIILARASQILYQELSAELGFNPLFRQGGYLFLAHTEGEIEYLEKNIELQNSLDVPSRLVSVDEIMDMVPVLDVSSILGGAYNPADGVGVHHAIIWGYAEAARRLGVKIYDHTEVLSAKARGGRVKSVNTSKGEIEADILVDAAGASSRDIAKMVGVEIPTKPYRREIMVTESVKPFLKPKVISLHNGVYINQTLRGEVVTGATDPDEPSSNRIHSSLNYLKFFARLFKELFPSLLTLTILRQWAGLYDISPDSSPIIGRVDELDGLLLACGWSGHGFMLSPIVGKLLAELILDGKSSISLEPHNLRRFKERRLLQEISPHEHTGQP